MLLPLWWNSNRFLLWYYKHSSWEISGVSFVGGRAFVETEHYDAWLRRCLRLLPADVVFYSVHGCWTILLAFWFFFILENCTSDFDLLFFFYWAFGVFYAVAAVVTAEAFDFFKALLMLIYLLADALILQLLGNYLKDDFSWLCLSVPHH